MILLFRLQVLRFNRHSARRSNNNVRLDFASDCTAARSKNTTNDSVRVSRSTLWRISTKKGGNPFAGRLQSKHIARLGKSTVNAIKRKI